MAASVYLLLALYLATSIVLVWRAGLPLRGAPGLPLLAVAALFLVAGVRRRRRAAASVTLLVVLVPFLAYESFLHLERPLPAHGAKARRVRELRAAGIAAYPAVFPSGLAALAAARGAAWLPRLDGEPVLPLAGVPGVVTVYCHGDEGWIEYPSDRYGFRNPDPVWDAAGRLNVLLGDSFVQGFCVSEQDGLPALLGPLGEVLALGVNGTSILVQYATFVEYASSLPLGRVVWLYFEGNDRREFRAESGAPFWQRYLAGERARGYAAAARAIGDQLRRIVDEVLDEGELATVGHEIVLTALRRTALWLSAGRTQLLMADRMRRLGWSDAAGWSEAELAGAARLWRDVARRVTAAGGEILFVYLPSRERFETSTSEARLQALRREEAAVRSAWAREGLESLSLVGALGEPQEAIMRFEGVHLDAAGYRLVARRILDVLGCSEADACR